MTTDFYPSHEVPVLSAQSLEGWFAIQPEVAMLASTSFDALWYGAVRPKGDAIVAQFIELRQLKWRGQGEQDSAV